MRRAAAVLLAFWIGLVIGPPQASQAATEDISSIIEGFVSRQFPTASSHFWIVNGAPQQEKNEVVIDINTVVTLSEGRPPAEDRFLLLIVSGKLRAAQRIPLDGETVCQTET